jgi:hypothetical protein
VAVFNVYTLRRRFKDMGSHDCMSNDAELVAVIRYPSFWFISNFTTYDLFLHIRVAYGLSGFSFISDWCILPS